METISKKDQITDLPGDLKEEIINSIIKYKCITFKRCTLKSKQKSRYFFNSALLVATDAIKVLAKAYVIKARCLDYNVIMGAAYKGIALATAMHTYISIYEPMNVRKLVYNRKEYKDHGEGGLLVGPPLEDQDKILLVDDVFTAGTAIRQTLDIVEKENKNIKYEYAAAIVILDRQSNAIEEQKTIYSTENRSRKISITSLITKMDLIEYFRNHGMQRELHDMINDQC